MTTKRIAVIGAGVSGLAAVKSCLEDGLEPVGFERDSDIGGIWNYTEDTGNDRVCVYDDVNLNSTRVLMVYSDFPHQEKSDPLFTGHRAFLKYLNQYADRFDLKRHFNFGIKVVKVEPYEEGNQEVEKWKVQWETPDQRERKSELFDGVMICTGLESIPFVPPTPGLEEFKGPVVHSGHYKTHEPFKNKRVLVMGLGNSGAELSSFLGKYGSKVYLATNHGAWNIPRMWLFNLPYEYFLYNRFLTTVVPAFIWNNLLTAYVRSYADNDALGILPSYNFGGVIPTISEDLKHRLAYGQVKLRRGVLRIMDGRVRYKDNSEDVIDAIVLATGFEKRFAFLPVHLQPWDEKRMFGCYLHTFLPDKRYKSLGFIGVVKATGPLMPIAELQARAFTSTFIGRTKLPSTPEMKGWITSVTGTMDANWYRDKHGAVATVNWLPTLVDIARYIGVEPNPWTMLLNDFQLGKALLMNMPVPAAYRLQGPHRWSGARETVIGSDRVLHSIMSPLHDGKSYLQVMLRSLVKMACVLIFATTALFLMLYYVTCH